jgi:hypothetical protein
MAMPFQPVTIEIEKYRNDPSSRQWELPAWGHPISQGVFPLFITFEERLFPVATAFMIGRGIPFVVSALHNIREAWKKEERLSHLLAARDLPNSIDLGHVGFSVLYHQPNGRGGIDIAIWPLENITAAPPTDVVFGFPEFHTKFPTLVNRLSFDLPAFGKKVWSIGYAEFKSPADGIPVSEIRNGTFDWRRDYGHKLMVVEGFVERIFTQKFIPSYLEGACFTFDAEISHAQSGGPVLSTEGLVRGINSAGATLYFDGPTSIASLLYPFLSIQLRFGATMGPVRMNGSGALIELLGHGMIPTDGSEGRVAIGAERLDRSFAVYPRADKAMSSHIHDDFSAYQQGRKASKQATGPVFRLTRKA